MGVDDVMSGSDGPENLKILKNSHLGVDLGPCRQLSSNDGVVKLGSDDGVEKLRLDHEMCRTLGVMLA